MHACETRPTTKSDKKNILTFERKVPIKMYGPLKNVTTSDYEKRINVYLKKIFHKLNIKNIVYS